MQWHFCLLCGIGATQRAGAALDNGPTRFSVNDSFGQPIFATGYFGRRRQCG
jgi:hypothetical protein